MSGRDRGVGGGGARGGVLSKNMSQMVSGAGSVGSSGHHAKDLQPSWEVEYPEATAVSHRAPTAPQHMANGLAQLLIYISTKQRKRHL